MSRARSATGSLASGFSLGAYRILRCLSSGPLGCIYQGERRDRPDEKVAIKVLMGQGFDDPLRRQFEREREILAALRHPRIARFLDSGMSEDGDPYFVMEYVDGEPILAYADKQKLSTTARLGLFLQVCDAVLYAHAHLVIHRDLKNSNILVDRQGQVKLLDFGIAKYLQEGKRSFSQINAAALSLESASPEQVQGNGLSTATDVYGLGSLLYRLLTGVPYLEMSGSSPLALAALVVETRPPSPSKRLQQLSGERNEALIELAALRQVKPQRLIRELKGDLDRIVCKCLEKQPEDRYQGVAPLVEDLRDHLLGTPVHTKNRTAFWHKLSIRNRALLISLLLGLIALVPTSLILLRLQNELVRESRAAKQYQQLLYKLLTETGQLDGKGYLDPMALSEWTGRRLEDGELEPEVRAGLGLAHARLLAGTQQLAEARRTLELTGVGFHRETEPRYRVEVEQLAARLDLFEGDSASAVRALAAARAQYPLSSSAEWRGRVLFQEIEMASLMGSFEVASRALTQMRELEPAIEPTQQNRYKEELGIAHYLLGRDQEAENLLEQVLGQGILLFGDRHQELAWLRSYLAQVKLRLGKYDEAEFLGRKSIDQKLHYLPEIHAALLIDQFGLVEALAMQHKFAEATLYLQKAEQVVMRFFGERHYLKGQFLLLKGWLLMEEGYLAEADTLLAEAMAVLKASLGEKAPLALSARLLRVGTQLELGDLSFAQAQLAHCSDLATEGPDPLGLKLPYQLYMAQVAAAEGRLEEAEAHLGLAREELTQSPMTNSLGLAKLDLLWADLLAQYSRFSEAQSKLATAAQVLELRLPKQSALRAYSQNLEGYLGIMNASSGEQKRFAQQLASGFSSLPVSHRAKRELAAARLREGLAQMGSREPAATAGRPSKR